MIRKVLLAGVFLLSLNFGVIEALGINISLVRVAIEAVMLILLAHAIFNASRDDFLRALKWVGLPLLAFGIGVITSILYRASHLETLLFAREFLMPLVFFLLFLIKPPDEKEWKVLTTLLVLIAAIQLPVAAMKYWALGVNEKGWIGTFHHSAGQLGLLMPMLAVAFLWAYAIKRERFLVPVLLATGFALISVVNEKRAVVLIVPALVALLIVMDFVTARADGRKPWYCNPQGLGRLFVAFLLPVAVVITCALQNVPSFNTRITDYEDLSDRSVPAYISEYLLRDYDSAMNKSANPNVETNRNIQMGRFRLWMHGIDLAVGLPLKRFLFGAGGGWLLNHPLLIAKPDDIFFHRLHLRGPTSTGFRHFFEMGAAGLLLMLAWMGQIGWALLQRVSHPSADIIALGAAGAWSILVFDYVLYSQVGWGAGVFAPVCFLIITRVLSSELTKPSAFSQEHLLGIKVKYESKN